VGYEIGQIGALWLDYTASEVCESNCVLQDYVQRYQTGRAATRTMEIKAEQSYRLARVQWIPVGNTKYKPVYVVIFDDCCESEKQRNVELVSRYDNSVPCRAAPCFTSYLFAYSAEIAEWTISLASCNITSRNNMF
jgi:hypothetical protein